MRPDTQAHSVIHGVLLPYAVGRVNSRARGNSGKERMVPGRISRTMSDRNFHK